MPKSRGQRGRSFDPSRMSQIAKSAAHHQKPIKVSPAKSAAGFTLDPKIALLLVVSGLVNGVSAQPDRPEHSDISGTQIAMTVVAGQLYLLTQLRDLYNLIMRDDLSAEECKLIKDRLIAVNINFVRDFAWALFSGVGMASTMAQNSAIALLTILFTTLNLDRRRFEHETVMSILKSGIASTLGLLAWCGPLQSPAVLNWNVWAQATAVGLCEGSTQVISAALFDWMRSPDRSIRPLGMIKTLLEGIFNAPAGAVWLLMASIPQKDQGTDMAGTLNLGESTLSALSIACAVATTNWVSARAAPKLSKSVVDTLEAVPERISAWLRPAQALRSLRL